MTRDPAAPAAGTGGARRWRDPRVWLGVAVTVFFLWLTLRDVPFAEVARVMAGADWWLLVGLSVPLYVLLVWLRALRWGHLTDPIQPIPRSSLARAVAVGFMANNVFPLRMGEVVRCWYLARDAAESSAAAIFGTVILERILDTICVLLLVGIVIAWQGSSADGVLAQGALLLVPVALLPIAGLVLLKAAPEFVIRVAATVLRPLPRLARLAEPCWEEKGCEESDKARCPAHKHQSIPCWMARRWAEGWITSKCYACERFALRPASVAVS